MVRHACLGHCSRWGDIGVWSGGQGFRGERVVHVHHIVFGEFGGELTWYDSLIWICGVWSPGYLLLVIFLWLVKGGGEQNLEFIFDFCLFCFNVVFFCRYFTIPK